MNTHNIISEIQAFLEGSNNDLKYLVNVETDANERHAMCVIHEPGQDQRIEKVEFTPFLYIKDLNKTGHKLFNGNKDKRDVMIAKYGIKIKKMKTGNHPRLENGYPYLVTTTKTYSDILNFFKEAGIDPFEKIYDSRNQLVRDVKGRAVSKYRDLYYLPKLDDQFFISTGARLFKGIEEYKHLHKLVYDIETSGLRFEHTRVFAIGVKDNRGFEHVLEVSKPDDDDAERELIQDFFNLVDMIRPAVIAGYNSEFFDYEFLLGRMEILNMDIEKLSTTLHPKKKLYRRNGTVKIGNKSEHYRATVAWGYTILDIMHAAKRTAAVNTDIKNTKLKYICKYEDIAKKNRMYIDAKDGNIFKFWKENPLFIINPEKNEYIQVPKEFEDSGKKLYLIQNNKDNISEKDYKNAKNKVLSENPEFVTWIREKSLKLFLNQDEKKPKIFRFEMGKNILRQYLLDDLWETEQVDNLYNQSSFLLAKIVPTTYGRIATMGNAAVWNLLMTTWSYENGLAIPHPDEQEKFSGGLARCYKKGYTRRLVKIDYASLYPMIQLTHDVFPLFDITGVIKKMLLYMTTTRNIYKKLANDDEITDVEKELLKTIDYETYDKLVLKSISEKERNLFKVKQLPIKILNNSLFGALGSGFAFNWSDNTCAARITCTGRLYLRQAITFFKQFNCIPLLAVTDGINFGIPDNTTIKVNDDGVDFNGNVENTIENMWKYKGKSGISALIEMFNDKHMPKPYMLVDNDGEFKSCLNLSRINYALLIEKTDKETGEVKEKIKFTGNTIKSKTMPEYIEEFIDNGMKMILDGKGEEFIDYYYSYSEKIFYKQIPLKKIASKSKIKMRIDDYINRGTDKNGKIKARQAHMELVILEREKIAKELFEEHFDKLKDDDDRSIEEYDILTIQEKVSSYMPPEPELDSIIYYVNNGERKSHGDVKTDPKSGDVIIKASIINQKNLEENPEMTGDYNVEKYLAAFNERVSKLLDGYDPEILEKILVKVKRSKIKDSSGKKIEKIELKKEMFTSDQLMLKNFDKDDYNESMFLEDKEVEFWNKTGFDPRLVWNGFKTIDKEEFGEIYYQVYEDAVNYISDIMVKSGKPKVKSVNSTYNKGDYILLKSAVKKKLNNIEKGIYYKFYDLFDNKYSLGYFNGNFVEILRENLVIPKSNIELKFEEDRKIQNEKINQLNTDNNLIYEKEIKNIENNEFNKVEIFKEFLKMFNLPPHIQMNELFEKEPASVKAFEKFCNEKNKLDEDDVYDYDYDDSDI